jgi:hypothetical protein
MPGNTFRYRWTAAEVRWGYQVAATLADVVLVVDASGSSLTARVLGSDPFRLSQRALTLRVNRSPSPWRWPIVSLQIAGTEIRARLGPALE